MRNYDFLKPRFVGYDLILAVLSYLNFMLLIFPIVLPYYINPFGLLSLLDEGAAMDVSVGGSV